MLYWLVSCNRILTSTIPFQYSIHSLISSQIEWQISSKCQGVYMLLMHYDSTVREWANTMAQMLGPIAPQDWDQIAQPVVVQCMSNLILFCPHSKNHGLVVI